MILNMLEELINNVKESEDMIPKILDDGFNGIPFGDIDEHVCLLNICFIILIIIHAYYRYNKIHV